MTPKAFISYSWTTPDHEAWVLRFAEDLRSQAVDVVLDKWDLREGHDANAFMEQMVTRDDIGKVILVCDKAYAEKSDSRRGGAGTEAQIISAGLYTRTSQDKFVAVVRERDEDGIAYLPTYYKGRIYIDLLDEARYGDEFDKLLRWIFDKPLYVKPELGKPPAFVSSDNAVKLSTAVPLRRALDAMRSGRDQAEAHAEDYLVAVVAELEKFRLQGGGDNFDEKVIASIESALPLRNELIEFFLVLAAFRSTDEMATVVHRFFEQMIVLNHPVLGQGHTNWTFDNFKFLSNEFFLYFVAAMLSRERFSFAAKVIHKDFYVGNLLSHSSRPMSAYNQFNVNLPSLEAYNKRKGLHKISLQATMLEERNKGVGVEFRHVMTADLVLYLAGEKRRVRWYPSTLLYTTDYATSFEIFARATSLAFFDILRPLLAIDDLKEFQVVLHNIRTNPDRVPSFDYRSLNIDELVCMHTLGTKP